MVSFGLNPGTFLFHNTYRIERVLGQGGFGITYLAKDMNLGRFVAIKELFPSIFCHREAYSDRIIVGGTGNEGTMSQLKDQFLKEAQHIASFNHPGIVHIMHSFEENNTVYYAMEYIEGQSLAEIIEENGPLSPETAERYIAEVGEAVSYLHQIRFNHLDIKPGNIMVRNSDQRVVLIDFGLSIHFGHDNMPTKTMPWGISDGFAPREQYANSIQSFSPQADIYALGATLYYCLMAKVPPIAISRIDAFLDFHMGITGKYVKTICKAMALDISDRYATVDTFLRDLKRKRAPRTTNNSQNTATIRGTGASQPTQPVITRITTNTSRRNSNPSTHQASSSQKTSSSNKSFSNEGWGWTALIIGCLLVGVFIFSRKEERGNSSAAGNQQETVSQGNQETESEIIVYDEPIIEEPETVSVEEEDSPVQYKYYYEGSGGIYLPSTFTYLGEEEYDLNHKMFSDGISTIYMVSLPSRELSLYNTTGYDYGGGFPDQFSYYLDEALGAKGSPVYSKDSGSWRVASGYTNNNQFYYCKWATVDDTTYVASLVGPTWAKDKYNDYMTTIFTKFPNVY